MERGLQGYFREKKKVQTKKKTPTKKPIAS